MAWKLQTRLHPTFVTTPGKPSAMKKLLCTLAVALAAVAAPTIASAQLAFNVGATTDYRYRGISQSRLKPAVQGGVDYAAGPFYAGAWASTVKWIKDGGGDASYELDLYGGVKGEAMPGLNYDVGVLRYLYPGSSLGTNPDTTEVYGALTYGPATLKYSHAVTNLFGFSDSKNSGYLDLSATFDVMGFAVTPHIGKQTVKNNGDFSYVDYSVTVAKEVMPGLTLSAMLVDTDTDKYVGPNNKDLGKAGLVVAAKFAF
jgi:uncharacterized protein (TIGR02001 family)